MFGLCCTWVESEHYYGLFSFFFFFLFFFFMYATKLHLERTSPSLPSTYIPDPRLCNYNVTATGVETLYRDLDYRTNVGSAVAASCAEVCIHAHDANR